jgi:large subunit ribosomal protein L20
MPRSKGGLSARNRRSKFQKLAKGFKGVQRTRYHATLEAIFKAGRHAYIDRRRKKREFRMLWIHRINAAARLHGLPYNQFILGLHKAGVVMDRKALADIAISEPEAFTKLVDLAKAQLA